MKHRYFIGLMSGTSADGIDAVLVSTEGANSHLVGAHHRAMPSSLRDEIIAFRQSGDNELHRMAILDQLLAEEYASAVKQLLGDSSVEAAAVTAIGNHGQTIRHQPDGAVRYTCQSGDPNRLAELTGITVVADFRRRDMAAGGQGAPLVPAFHRARLADAAVPTAIVNIGGIANVSVISADEDVTGWDTGPGNTLMDAWISRHQGKPYDEGGKWAAEGQVIKGLLETLLADSYFFKPNPKSTGPEYFDLDWLAGALTGLESPDDVQRTLAELTVESIARALEAQDYEVVRICGGGARNDLLMERLSDRLAPTVVTSTAAIGVDPEWVEAWAFAWLAEQTLAGQPGNIASVTGAAGERVLGAIYPAGISSN